VNIFQLTAILKSKVTFEEHISICQ